MDKRPIGVFDSGVAEFDRGIAYMPIGYFQDTFYMQEAGHQVVIATTEPGYSFRWRSSAVRSARFSSPSGSR